MSDASSGQKSRSTHVQQECARVLLPVSFFATPAHGLFTRNPYADLHMHAVGIIRCCLSLL